MSATFTIDTQQATQKLMKSGFKQEQAAEIVDLIVSSQDGIVTKEYFKEYLDYKFEKELNPLKLDMMAIKTTLAILVGGIIAVLVKLYT